MAPGFDFWDNTISTIWAANIDDCRGKCSRTSGCIAAVYGPGMCRLRSDFSGGRSVQPLTAIVAPATGNLVSNWQDCTPVNACVSDGWVCCVAPEEVSSGRPTCRPINMCAGASSSLNWTPVQYASYQGSTIQQNTMTVASCTGWCAAVSNCLGAVYSRSSKLCVLKSTLASGQASLSDDSVTYIPSGGMAPGFDFWDNTISTIWAANIDDCRGKCSRTSGCIAAVYGPGMCRLRSDFSGGRSVQPLTAIVAPATGNLVSNWQDCTPVNACVSDGWVCCVAPEEVSSGRPTCRPINMCAGSSSLSGWVGIPGTFYQGGTIQQNTMTVASCTGWCAAVSNCVGTVYTRSSTLCTLKSVLSVNQAALNDDSVTYITSGGSAPGFDFWDNLISTQSSTSVLDCRTKCSQTQGCLVGVYGPGICRLRSDFSGGKSVQPVTTIVVP
ncbi:hypothetical protein BCR33DRAFT_721667 [Rhizoclosmatium globosum]|uniref:Apple domain-containing protein n=1 Tax=Rhizoclosmatium globosum TaxID=329046 RepID=A0A1Y2BQK0_9FUNG|nr:hypothetical protein BCR33DRAFT_721667 [Rhizoclosmatium globosum]|eukprot:ORY37018.1 hypothetical protein BCR33DRAFT_721667 [Rhizoclosmatium globosum]